MTLRSLLVLLPDGDAADPAAAVARQLAKAHGAHVVGVAPTGLVEVPTVIHAAAELPDLAATAARLLRHRAEAATERFAAACRHEGLDLFEAVVDEADTLHAVRDRALAADLVVLAQPDPKRPDHAGRRAVVEDLLLRVVRPVLLVPYANAATTIGSRVLAAWDGGREATRALADALPLLQRAQRVDVLRWTDKAPRENGSAARRDDALRRWLSSQGVEAVLRTPPASGPVGELLLSAAADAGADLVVMGAFAHPRWTERVLGGVTRTLLDTMTVPVLMSR